VRRGATCALTMVLATGFVAGCTKAGTPSGRKKQSPSTTSVSSASTSTLPPTSALPVSCGNSNGVSGSPSTTPWISDIGFASPTIGWATGVGAIWATTDGGARWVSQYQGGSFTQIDPFDTTHAWAVGPGGFAATSDGTHWASLPEPPETIDSVHFVSAEVGVAVAGGIAGQCGGILLKTEDGGTTWQQIPSPPNVQSACFSDASHGWLSAGVANHADVFYSGTSGHSWQEIFSPPLTQSALADGSGVAALADLQCAQGDVWALYTGTGGCASNQCSWFAYHGSSPGPWRQVFQESYIDGSQLAGQPGEMGPRAGYPGPFSAISASSAVFVGDDVVATPRPQAALLLTTNNGTDDTELPNLPLITDPTATAFLSSEVGWLVGESYVNGCSDQTGPSCPWVIAATSNGGQTWTTQFEVTP